MKSLEGPKEPFTIELVNGLSVTVRPRDWFSLSVATASAQRILDRLESSAADCIEAGWLPDMALVDLANPDHRAAVYHTLVVQELAVGAITEWSGVALDGSPMSVTAANIRQVMKVWQPGSSQPLGDIFYRKYMEGHQELADAKKGLAVCAGGISTPTQAANTAKDARKTISPAPAENPD